MTQMPALLLVGHGSTRHPHSRRATERLADSLRQTGAYEAVAAAFWKESPGITEALNALTGAERIWVVPNFASDGHFTEAILPAAIAASAVANRVTVTPAIGGHPRVLAIIQRRVTEAIARAGSTPSQTGLLLVAHGARQPTASATRARALAERAVREGWAGTATACFLEEIPLVADWDSLTPAMTVVVVTLLTAEGLHGAGDIPPLFGVDPAVLTAEGPALLGPLDSRGRKVWYWRSLGSDPEIARLVLDMTGTQPNEP